MARSRFQPKDGRFLAVVLLLIVLMLIYLVGIHWWFVAPQMQFANEMQDLREQQSRYREIAGQKAEIEKRLAEVKEYEQNNQAFLPETDANAASAALIQRLKQCDERSCEGREALSERERAELQRRRRGAVQARDRAGTPAAAISNRWPRSSMTSKTASRICSSIR